MKTPRHYGTIDKILLCLVVIYALFGLTLLLSASIDQPRYLYRQISHITLGLTLLLITAYQPPERIRQLSPWLYALGILLLLCVLLIGQHGKGAQRWLRLGPVKFEPSEILKLGLPLCLATFVHHRPTPLSSSDLLTGAALIALPFLLIFLQPDLGTGLLITFVGTAVLLLAGMPLWVIRSLLLSVVACSPLLWQLLHDYQKKRIMTLLFPSHDQSGTAYHITQAKIAIGSGGWWGKGFAQGSQAHLNFLPEHNTDFIFALCAEEWGLIGCLFLIGLMCAITLRSLIISWHATDQFSRVASASLAFTFFLCSVINIAMVIGLIPVVGVPLPLMSYGGTNAVIMLVLFGVILSIHRQRRLFY